MPKLRRIYFEIAAALCALGAFAAMGSQIVGGRGLLLGNGLPMFGDFIAFWSAGRLVLDGDVALVHDARAIMDASHQAVPEQSGYFPWRNPPPFLLIMTPLALLPYAAAALVFLAGSTALFIYALRPLLPDRRALFFPLASPTYVFHLGSTQLTPLVTGLHALALHWLDKRPIAAGAAIALLVIKPHLAVVWPLLLLCQGRWRTFFSAALFTLAVLAVTGFAFGFGIYGRWLANLGDAEQLIATRQLPPNTLGSLYGVLIWNGAPSSLAGVAQGISAAGAAIVATVIFLRSERLATLIALPAATLLISPHLFFYDTLLLAISAAAIAQRRLGRAEIALACVAFAIGGFTLALGFVIVLPLCWAAAWAVLLYALFTPEENAAPLPA